MAALPKSTSSTSTTSTSTTSTSTTSTSTSTLSQQEIKTLEQTRQRLFQLSKSLASLQHNILQAEALPTWTSLQSLSSIISQNLSSVSTHLSTHASLLSSMAVYPLETYPGKTQEGLLGQLLRKKLEPEVEDWVARGRKAAEEVGMGGIGVGEVGMGVGAGDTRMGGMGKAGRREKMEELWSWAGLAANELARGHEWGGEFTREERERGVENVVTGLVRRRRGLGEDEEDDEEEDEEGNEEGDGGEDKMEIVMQAQTDQDGEGGESKVTMTNSEREREGKAEVVTTMTTTITESKDPPLPPLSLEEVLKFLVTGIEPRR